MNGLSGNGCNILRQTMVWPEGGAVVFASRVAIAISP